MNLTIHQTYLPQDDPDAALRFYCDVLGFELRGDVGKGPGGSSAPERRVVPPAAVTRASRRRWMIVDMMAKGTFGAINFATPSLDTTFAELEAAGVDIVQEPLDQPWGLRDCAVRDPAGNLVRIIQVR
ncbi:MAG: VOC family protein [Actinomycetales bacterium]|uniref:VOC family protein n=1 Tax=Candidatus Phosphoribacter hodrii TaxID=2953743 RepID=A0A935IJ87_9MICO|nr:VOC family protein [Candidatus Phosphoribacter hodrii]